ncbi:hypothetical protein [Nocardia bovistercoris]|uniref:Uncharacterized protein n=1 Tax=Nocardia bovistercoris TaxID=2785916 RepID=A0A931IG16_9NOCA|nr:hypothetical protein [Nocardia bovistercoris]MBH0779387.1 hypothetical protein [Nocardia bovistercoris]
MRSVKRTPPDLRKLGRAAIAVALAEAAAEKTAELAENDVVATTPETAPDTSTTPYTDEQERADDD